MCGGSSSGYGGGLDELSSVEHRQACLTFPIELAFRTSERRRQNFHPSSAQQPKPKQYPRYAHTLRRPTGAKRVTK